MSVLNYIQYKGESTFILYLFADVNFMIKMKSILIKMKLMSFPNYLQYKVSQIAKPASKRIAMYVLFLEKFRCLYNIIN